MTPRFFSALLVSVLVVVAAHADPPSQGGRSWDKKTIKNVLIEVPTDCKTDTQTATPPSGAVQQMTKFSFRNAVLDLELVFLSFLSGTAGDLDKAAENMSSEIRKTSGQESLTRWETTTVSGRPARHIATNPDPTHQARQVTLIDDTRTKNQLIIVDVSYDSDARSGKTECERIMRSVEIKADNPAQPGAAAN